MTKDTPLVIGADSFLGSALIRELRRRGRKVLGTTRRRQTVGPDRLFLDLADPHFNMSANISHVYFVAADTSYKGCGENEDALKVNALSIAALAESFLAAGVFVVFTSSNAVFGGDRPWPLENSPLNPLIPYAIQKALAEKKLREAAMRQKARDLLAIIRLTKILDWKVPPLPEWHDAWRQKKIARAFTDFIFAPVSLDFAVSAMADIAEKKLSGNFHISGSENLSYQDFARMLAMREGVDPALVQPALSEEAGVHLHFKPVFSGLGMEDTARRAGLQPQTPEEVVSWISSQYAKENEDGGLPSQ